MTRDGSLGAFFNYFACHYYVHMGPIAAAADADDSDLIPHPKYAHTLTLVDLKSDMDSLARDLGLGRPGRKTDRCGFAWV